jgi:hypothetical protein
LYQRDAIGYITTATKKIYYADNYQSTNVRSINGELMHDKIARQGKKIGFNIDKNWNGVKDSMAFKVSVFDDYAGTLNLKYSNGTEIVTLSKPLLGDQLLKTFTFFVSDFKMGANIGGKFDFTLESGDNVNNIVVSFVRVVQAGTSNIPSGIKKRTINNESVIKIAYSESDKTIFTTSDYSLKRVDVYNVVGQKIISITPDNTQSNILTSNWGVGTYIVVASDNHANIVRKKIQIR